MVDTSIWVNNRTIYLSSDIRKLSVGEINSSLLNLIETDDKEDKKLKEYTRDSIKIYVNSYGGSVYDMWSTIDIILNSKTPIHTYCTGYAMSAGLSIYLAGHKRYASEHATFLYHQLSSWMSGTYQDLIQEVAESTRLQNEIEKYTIIRTKITQEKLDQIRKEKFNWFIPTQEAIELGIVDEMIKSE